jgi:hypothetical protein
MLQQMFFSKANLLKRSSVGWPHSSGRRPLDEQHGGGHSPAKHLNCCGFVRQRGRLSRNYVQIANGARLVLIGNFTL